MIKTDEWGTPVEKMEQRCRQCGGIHMLFWSSSRIDLHQKRCYFCRNVHTQTRDIRTLPVKQLEPQECRQLLYHSHICPALRKSAYLLIANSDTGWWTPEGWREDWTIYFTAERAAEIRKAIEEGI